MIHIKTIEDATVWDTFVTAHPEANFLQSWQWGEFQLSRNRAVVRRGVFDDETLIGVYTGHIEKAKRGHHMQIAGGPIIDWKNQSAVQALFTDIKQQAKKLQCVYVRIRPQKEESTEFLSELKALGLQPAPIYLSVELAGILDLRLSEEDILKGMRQRLRRALRKAEKNAISIETTTDPAAIDEFYNIQLQTAGRQQFIAFSKEFLQKQFAAFAKTGNAVLYTARHEGEVLAQNFMIFYGNEASYHYGVSTELGTKLSGAPLLHMQAMRDARERGIERYNFWGIVNEQDTKHRFYGVSVFKRGFGVQELQYTKAHDMVIQPLPYIVPFVVDSIRRLKRRV